MEALIIKEEILINGTTQEVWDALINPEKTKRYMFNCEAVSNWKVGSRLLWNANINGNPTTFVSGVVRDFEPENKLVFTTFDPNSSIKDIPENHIPVTYTLRDKAGKTFLTVMQGDFSRVAQGRKRYESTIAGGGWASVLADLKKVVEQ
ncbi:MAG: SRPBCC domain-containing protein [Cytophagales bacterium]|nr:SRPBCC domain-containing protein [Cytophagales bacterium]